MGKTRYDGHHLTGKPVFSGEFSYGLSNAWSLYGGTQFNSDYQANGDWYRTGSIFFLGHYHLILLQSFARFTEKKIKGRSYRLNYAKSF